MESYGAFAIFPTLVVLVVALITKRTIESLLAGVLIGLLMISPTDMLSGFASTALNPQIAPEHYRIGLQPLHRKACTHLKRKYNL